jgi:hypothetical protein
MFSNPSVTVSRYTSFPYNQRVIYHTMVPHAFQKQQKNDFNMCMISFTISLETG